MVYSNRAGSHCFIKCNGWIVDVTSGQFDDYNKRVEVRKNDNGNWYWKSNVRSMNVYTAHSVAQIKSLLEDWDDSQNPFASRKEWMPNA